MKRLNRIYLFITAIVCCAEIQLLCSGCLFIPYHDSAGIDGVSREITNAFSVHKTARSDVLFWIGPPNIRYDHDRLFIYKWHGSYGFLASIDGGGFIKSQEALCIFFNPDNTLKSYKYLSQLLTLLEDDDPRCKFMLVCDKDWRSNLINRCTREEKPERFIQ